MPQLLIDCPETLLPVKTGMSVSRESFDTVTLKNNATDCPHCGQMHRWDKEDAYFKGDVKGEDD